MSNLTTSTSSVPGTDHLARLRAEEFAALRATIRERGTRRVTLAVATLVSWAALAIASEVLVATPVSTLIPLSVLAIGFEAVFALHVGVERVGRYLQVEYEGPPGAPAWEHTAMRFGSVPAPAAGRVDPLFSTLFIFGVLLNMVPVLLATVGLPGGPLEFGVFGLVHLALIVRILRARAYAGRQRALDLAIISAANDRPSL